MHERSCKILFFENSSWILSGLLELIYWALKQLKQLKWLKLSPLAKSTFSVSQTKSYKFDYAQIYII